VRAALGDPGAATTQYELVRVIERLNRASGVAVDLELARFEADHARDRGADPRRAVAMARRALAERPTIYASDTLGWALRQAGRPRPALPHARAAVRLGTRDAGPWYHPAAVDADLGMTPGAPRPGRGPARPPRRGALVPPGRRRGRPGHARARPPPPGRGVRDLPLPDR